MNKLLSYSKWGRMGNHGNQLFELASLYGMAERCGRNVALPQEWKYQQYFEHVVPRIDPIGWENDINEPHYHHQWEYWDREFKAREKSPIISVCGWLQSSKYFPNKEFTKGLFKFKQEFRDRIYNQWKDVLSKPTIAITIRHGKDYIDNGNYEILPIEYYVGALYKNFPDWRENYNVIVFADDFQWAKMHLSCSENIYFAEGLIDVEQQCLATLCTHYILANSTFSWWCAYLSENPTPIVIRPAVYFKNYLLQTSDIKDFWEKEWKIFDHRGWRFSMRDVEFHIPVKFDHKDRLENLSLVVGFLNKYFDTSIVIGEQGGQRLRNTFKGRAHYVNFGGFPKFHRTAMLNHMARGSLKPIIVNFDADNICPILQLLIGADIIRKGQADMVYPYDGRVARVNRQKWLPILSQEYDFGVFHAETFRGTRPFDPKSVGHIIMWNKKKFFDGGGENEHFISYGPEDVERMYRFEKLGYRIMRVQGIVYHIDHFCGPDSGGSNPSFGKNYDELKRIQSLSTEELRREASNWSWVNKKAPVLTEALSHS